MADQFIYLALAFAVGAAVGSFLNVCIARWPHEQSVVSPPSRCPNCGHGIRWYENVPIFGWLRLRGRCAGCRQPISPRYPLVELAVALLWVACAWWIGPTLTGLRVAILATSELARRKRKPKTVKPSGMRSVSYTHLTLPTNSRV